MRKIYNKLVRDNIIQIIEKENKACTYRTLEGKEYLSALCIKLQEEYEEFKESQAIEELADIEEVLLALVEAKGYSLKEFEEIRRKKALKNGAFKKKVFLISVED